MADAGGGEPDSNELSGQVVGTGAQTTPFRIRGDSDPPVRM
jgi:hypothetical protein